LHDLIVITTTTTTTACSDGEHDEHRCENQESEFWGR
jgi:hypothetical protein